MTRKEEDVKNEATLKIESKINEVFLTKLLKHIDETEDFVSKSNHNFCLHRAHDRDYNHEYELGYKSSDTEILVSWKDGYCEAYSGYADRNRSDFKYPEFKCLEFFNKEGVSMKKIFSFDSTPLYLFDKAWEAVSRPHTYKSVCGYIDDFTVRETEKDFLQHHHSCAKANC